MGNVEKFDRIAEQYDTEERAKIAKIIATAIRAQVAFGEEKCAIDYGCGTGLVGMELMDIFDSILFVDASEKMVERVRKKIEQTGSHSAKALCCDLTAGDAPDLRADYILVVQTLLHVKEIELLLSRLYQALNGGGHLLVIDFDKNEAIDSKDVHNGFQQEELIHRVIAAGFCNVKSKTFFHGSKIFMNQDASLFILDAEKIQRKEIKR